MVLVVLGFCFDWFAVGLFMVGFDLLGLVGGWFLCGYGYVGFSDC